MEKKNQIYIFVVPIVLLVAALAYVTYRMLNAEKQNQANAEEMAYEKQQLQNDYQDLATQMEGFSYKTNNDSLLQKIDEEKQHVQLLLEELKTVKATDSQKILALRKELASVRKVLQYYVAQVDSLNTVNAQLQTENRVVTAKYQQASQTVSTLSDAKQKLEEKVNIASQLNATNIVVDPENSRGRTNNSVKRVAVIKISFDIAKNVTAQVGEKTVYMCLVSPNGEILTKSSDNVFQFENKQVPYSSKRDFNYGGDQTSQSIFWKVEETLLAGTYRVDLFIDGHIVGSQFFNLK